MMSAAGEQIRYEHFGFALAREPFLAPFHFKGGSFNEKWLNVLRLYPAGTLEGAVTAVGGNAVLWSDAAVFSAHSETGGNLLMSAMAERAALILRGASYSDPIQAMQQLIPELHEYGRAVSLTRRLRPTFTLNAAVALDLALWKLYAASRGITSFLDLIPPPQRGAFSFRQERLARVPLITYSTRPGEVLDLVEEGHFFLKIKIGQAGGQAEMVEKDLNRLDELHRLLRDRRTEHTSDGRLAYYLDANGRYQTKETLLSLIAGLEKMGALEQVALLEEPFADDSEVEVGDIPLRVAADESLHDAGDVRRKIELGYRAIALKPAGKTLSVSLLMAQEAHRNAVPCFVADSACVPVLLDWNRNAAAHLPPFPGLSTGILESNGAQNYRNWSSLIETHPCAGAAWLEPERGLFRLDRSFYREAGGILGPVGPYEKLATCFI